MSIFSNMFEAEKPVNAVCGTVDSDTVLLKANTILKDAIKLLSSIAVCTTLKTKSEMQAATYIIEKLGLPLHNDHQKNWDTLKTISYVLNNSDENSVILDAGGGLYSPILNALANVKYKHLYACDVVDVNDYSQKYNEAIKFSIQNIEQTDYADGQFDIVTALSVIEHGLDAVRFFSEMQRLIKPNGLLIITTDYWPEYIDCSGIFPYGEENPEMKVYQRNDIVELVDIAKNNGFSLCTPLNLDVQERVVRWEDVDREYTFLFLAFAKLH